MPLAQAAYKPDPLPMMSRFEIGQARHDGAHQLAGRRAEVKAQPFCEPVANPCSMAVPGTHASVDHQYSRPQAHWRLQPPNSWIRLKTEGIRSATRRTTWRIVVTTTRRYN